MKKLNLVGLATLSEVIFLAFSHAGEPVERQTAYVPVVSAKNCVMNTNESRHFKAGDFWTKCNLDYSYRPPLENEPDWSVPVRTVLRAKENKTCLAYTKSNSQHLYYETNLVEILPTQNSKPLSNILRIDDGDTITLRQPGGAPLAKTEFSVKKVTEESITFENVFFKKACESGFEISINEPDLDSEKEAIEYKEKFIKEIVDWNIKLQALRSGSYYKRGMRAFAMISRQLIDKMQNTEFLDLKFLVAHTLSEARKELKDTGSGPLSKNSVAMLSKILEALSRASNAGTLKVDKLEDLLNDDEKLLLLEIEQEAEYDEIENRVYIYSVSRFYESVRRARIAQAQLKDFLDPKSWPIISDSKNQQEQSVGEIK